MHEIVALVGASFALMGSPGPAPMALAANGSQFGLRATLGFYGGIMTAFVAGLGLSAVGIGAILALYPALMIALLCASLVYILYLARRLMGAWTLAAQADRDATPLGFRDGVVLNLMNPKLYLAQGALFASFTPQAYPAGVAVLVTALTMLAVAAITNFSWLLVGCFAGRTVTSPGAMAWTGRVFAGLMIVACVWALWRAITPATG